ncbi:DNA ligase [uncultured archaeon]|nr:DNA ligase [uncultured archaeon]
MVERGNMDQQTKNLTESLKKQIKAAQRAYYDGNPIMADDKYDAIEQQLVSLVGDTDSVGTSVMFAKVEHKVPMLSIENEYSEEDFLHHASEYGEFVDVEPKRDGISCELVYENGFFQSAETRGDGHFGEDITAQIKECSAIPYKISTKNIPDELRIRGELVMRNSDLEKLNAQGEKQFANTRNLVAGTIKQKNLSNISSRNIFLIPWDMYAVGEDNLLPESNFDRMKLTEEMGFPRYEGIKVHLKNPNAILDALHTILAQNEGNDITSDGVVLKADSISRRNELGFATKYTRFQHCFKPQHLESETTLIDVEYGIGRTGKITPVAILEPVALGGAVISRATLCNETYMNALGIYTGCKVQILRSGNTIPQIVGVVNKDSNRAIKFPTVFPSCGTELRIEQKDQVAQHFCPNEFCSDKIAQRLEYIGSRKILEIDNLGVETANELAYNSKIVKVDDLFQFGNQIAYDLKTNPVKTKQELKENYRSVKNIIKLVYSLEDAKTRDWDRWIAALEIPMIGVDLGKDIAKILSLGPDDMKDFPNKLLDLIQQGMDGIGPEKSSAIVEWVKNPENKGLCFMLYGYGVRPTSLVKRSNTMGQKLDGISYVITGTLSIGTRKEVEAKLNALGATALSSVTNACNLLIVGEDPGSKLEKAEKKGIKIVGEDWVREVLA